MGIKISKQRDKSYDEELRINEEEVIKREIGELVISEQQVIENRKNQLIREARKLTSGGSMATITQEMIDLGVSDAIATMNYEAELAARVKRFFLSGDDPESEDADEFNNDITIDPGHYLW
jgi:hypothetical protein